MRRVRCAIYTRKSSDEGLEQNFNSLDAQREACAAYILSQASEGWTESVVHYDDGGVSGGTLERPALTRLLADVAAGRVDIIVVYKVDRLSRSLFDFARLVEQFEAAGTSFVSVTQSFNTTNSMGRLTLNMLLSFAQFEREVTAERIRDKLAASKAKGMWMGGTPPIGYRAKGRSLAIIEDEAGFVRQIFDLYLQLGNVRALRDALERQRSFAPVRTTGTGKTFGGQPLTRGQLYLILKNPIYIGRISHKGATYPGLHEAIIDEAVFQAAQQKLKENLRGHRDRVRAKNPSLLAGKLVDEAGEAMMATHATKGSRRYRYYVSSQLHNGEGDGMRVPAREIEGAVTSNIAQAFENPLDLLTRCELAFTPADLKRLDNGACPSKQAISGIVDAVRIQPTAIEIRCSVGAIAAELGVEHQPASQSHLTLIVPARLSRSGRVLRLVQGTAKPLLAASDRPVVRLLARAHCWWREVRKGEANLETLAQQHGVGTSYFTRVLRLAFLSPEVTSAILSGQCSLDAEDLVQTGVVADRWAVQRALLGER
jgi:site-specific DNA recombinase